MAEIKVLTLMDMIERDKEICNYQSRWRALRDLLEKQAAQQNVQRTCPKCGGSIIEGTPSHYLECKYAVASR